MSESSLKFGTSGLRGLVVDLNGPPAYAYTRAFSEMIKEGQGSDAGGAILIARDLRASSPDIARLCAAAVADSGLTPIDCGAAPTPALALAAMNFGLPAIMVTGSHIPEDRNGLKFYRSNGEIDKSDESRIAAWHERLSGAAPSAPHSVETRDVSSAYRQRYLNFFPERALTGLTIGVYQHSSVARDLLVDILAALGATAIALGRAERFIPVDTEAVRPEDQSLARQWAREQRLDAIVSTDGDADRPLIADGAGEFLRGDLVGAMTAAFVGADAVVTPVSSNSAIETCRRFETVLRTRIGSPYVIDGMQRAAAEGRKLVVGFEANGGVLLGSDVAKDGRTLAALPTRDAMLPILALARIVAETKRPLADLVADFKFACALSGRLQNVASERSAGFIAQLEADPGFRDAAFAPLGGVVKMDRRDGLRLTTSFDETVHFRASGNAPELRVYVEAATEARANALLTFGLDLAKSRAGAS